MNRRIQFSCVECYMSDTLTWNGQHKNSHFLEQIIIATSTGCAVSNKLGVPHSRTPSRAPLDMYSSAKTKKHINAVATTQVYSGEISISNLDILVFSRTRREYQDKTSKYENQNTLLQNLYLLTIQDLPIIYLDLCS
jgi:hypothetical protein